MRDDRLNTEADRYMLKLIENVTRLEQSAKTAALSAAELNKLLRQFSPEPFVVHEVEELSLDKWLAIEAINAEAARSR